MDKILRVIVSVALSIVILGAGIISYKKLAAMRKPPRQRDQKIVPIVRVQEVYPKDLKLVVRGYGKARAVRSVELTAEVAGRVENVSPYLKAGYFVKKGDVLAVVDNKKYDLQIKRLEAQEKKWQAKIAQMNQEQKNLAEQIKLLQENVLLAKAQMERSMHLKETGVASQQVRDQDQRAYLDQANRLTELKSQAQLVPIRIAEANAEQRAVQAQLNEAKIELANTQIKVPFDARVRSAHAEVGAFVNTGTVIAVLDDSRVIEIPVMVSQEDFYKMGLSTHTVFHNMPEREGRIPAEVWSLIGNRRISWDSHVVRIEPMNAQSRTIPVVVEVTRKFEQTEEIEPLLMTGAFCDVEIQGQVLPSVYCIPRAALHEDKVYTAEDGKLAIKNVQIVHQQGDTIVIDAGLAPGDKVITTTLLFPVEGMAVLIQ